MSKRHSRKSGQSIVELGFGLIVLLPILLCMLNCLFVGIGAYLNEAVSRDAARAAASGAPSSLTIGQRKVNTGAPKDRVLAVINKVYFAGLPLKVRTTPTVIETVNDVPPQADGGAVDGEVSVTTTIDIYPPVQVQGLGSHVTLTSTHVMPITYMLHAS
jgi:hypothetical protein